MERETSYQHKGIVRKRTKIEEFTKYIWDQKLLYLMLLPGLIWFFVYRYLPMFGTIIAFKDYDFTLGMLSSPWADPWHKHFSYFINSPYFAQLLTNTFLISFYKLIVGTVTSLILAVLLNECRVRWFTRSVQTLSYMPHFLSWAIIYGIMIAFFSESQGLINRWLEELFGSKINFLASLDWFRSMLVFSDMWKDLGWGAIIYIAAMAGISPALYEGAKVDGASRLRMIWHITLPGIRHVIILLFIIKLGHILDAGFEHVYVMYNIRVYPVGDIIDTWVYRTGLEQLNFSVAAAAGVFKSIIGLIAVILSNRLARRWGGQLW